MCDVVRFLWPYMTNHGRASLVGRHYTSLGCLKEIVADASGPQFAVYLQHTSRRDDFESIVLFLKDSSADDGAASGRLGEAAAKFVSRFLYENMPYGAEAVQTVVQHLFTTTEAQRTYKEVAEFFRRTSSRPPAAGAVHGLSRATTGGGEDGYKVALRRAADVLGALEGQYLGLAPPQLWEDAERVLTLLPDLENPLDRGST
jgi:hypothetical protein